MNNVLNSNLSPNPVLVEVLQTQIELEPRNPMTPILTQPHIYPNRSDPTHTQTDLKATPIRIEPILNTPQPNRMDLNRTQTKLEPNDPFTMSIRDDTTNKHAVITERLISRPKSARESN